MRNYQLDEITTRPALRRQLADHFRRVKTDNPKVIDVLLFKGQAEVHEVMAHYTQRHHLVRAAPRRGSCCGRGGACNRSSAHAMLRLPPQITRYVAPKAASATTAAGTAAAATRSDFLTKCARRCEKHAYASCARSLTGGLACADSWRPTTRTELTRRRLGAATTQRARADAARASSLRCDAWKCYAAAYMNFFMPQTDDAAGVASGSALGVLSWPSRHVASCVVSDVASPSHASLD